MAWSRRKLLKALGWGAAGLTVVAGGVAAFAPLPVLPYRRAPTRADAAAWISLRPDGRIEVVSPRAEIGQGVAASIRQIVAEETGFALDRIVIVQPRTDRLPPVRATVGSDSIKDFGLLLAQAAAALATVLRREGARRLSVRPDETAIVEDAITAPDGRRVALVELTALPMTVDASSLDGVRPRSFDRNAAKIHVGLPLQTEQIRAIVTGDDVVYADDVRRPRMLFGAIVHAPRLGATLLDAQANDARRIPGFVALYSRDGRAGIVAETRGALERALPLVRAAWSDTARVAATDIEQAVDIDRRLDQGPLEHVVKKADLGSNVAWDVDLRLDVPMAAHAAMEPRTAVAEFNGGKLHVWAGTQDVTFVRNVLARELGLSEDNVVVEGMRVGGAFGGKTICTVELEAAWLARASGHPVKVQWTRAEEFREAFHRPPSSHRIRARLAADGSIADWWHAFRSGHVIFTSAAMGPALQFATSFVGDPGVLRGAVPPYAAQRSRVELEDVRLPVHTGPWRGLGAAPNVWAIETAIDALARHARRDPVDFRLANIDKAHGRLAAALRRVAASANWQDREATQNRAFGVACSIYKDMSYAAVVAEIARARAGMRVVHLWCAHDCGFVVNPDQVRAQIEGNLVWGIGMALSERLSIRDGHVAEASFADYVLPTYSAVPHMAIELVDDGHPPSGAGETAIVAATAAITNAFAAMTGRAVRRLPYDGSSV